MLSSQTRLHINDADVTATVVDGEAIMINLTSGVYYSTDAVGARIWELAVAGANRAEMTEQITAEYQVARQQAGEDIERLIAQFVEEKLLIPHLYAVVPSQPAANSSQIEYTAPHLDIYREMGHLFALDPPMPGLDNIMWKETR